MSDVPPNIQRFNLTALRLFAQLYDAFPTPVDIESTELGAEAAPDDLTPPEALVYAERADEVLAWLEEEGFIRSAGGNLGTSFLNVRLTLKGLTVLGYIPTVIQSAEKSEPLIDKIKRTLATGAESAGAEGVKALLGGVFKLAISYAGASAAGGISV